MCKKFVLSLLFVLAICSDGVANSEIPQFDLEFFPSQVFWLFVSYVVFHFGLCKGFLRNISDTRSSRNAKIVQNTSEAGELLSDAHNILESCKKMHSEANKKVALLMNNINESLEKKSASVRKSAAASFNATMYNLDLKLQEILEDQQLKLEAETDTISNEITKVIENTLHK